ncbi:hypothetical protein [Chondromyces apiculatus]|uniref:Uncharacterized protein n=1 Tax=Chondromyces apiculatus DSM 436 TaxID=1192034 RepID=A0A017SXP8_9BACT|nr:hypothetical protein [Chondromyces apiculatus]EYF01527.1 Hypothetical protein CAP_8088 [Chondromyces apiculatus DSM 436]
MLATLSTYLSSPKGAAAHPTRRLQDGFTTIVAAALVGVLPGCSAPSAGGADARDPLAFSDGADAPLAQIAAEIEALNGPLSPESRATFRDVLADTLAKDAYLCRPSARTVLLGDAPEGERHIAGVMPHYGMFMGPMSYLIRRRGRAWEVEARIAVTLPRDAARIELPDCGLAEEPGGRAEILVCRGTPYAQSGTTEACPGSGEFAARATPAAVDALLARWSREAEQYWNRDARAFGLPVTYDFAFVLADDARARGLRVDLDVPLSPTCGRTPYFSAMRSGWSLPVVAHEVGHVLGLLDEYEALSGIVPLYPKTPFPGAHISRMGLSMRERTLVLPLHHYLVLRRYFCGDPATVDPYAHALR